MIRRPELQSSFDSPFEVIGRLSSRSPSAGGNTELLEEHSVLGRTSSFDTVKVSSPQRSVSNRHKGRQFDESVNERSKQLTESKLVLEKLVGNPFEQIPSYYVPPTRTSPRASAQKSPAAVPEVESGSRLLHTLHKESQEALGRLLQSVKSGQPGAIFQSSNGLCHSPRSASSESMNDEQRSSPSSPSSPVSKRQAKVIRPLLQPLESLPEQEPQAIPQYSGLIHAMDVNAESALELAAMERSKPRAASGELPQDNAQIQLPSPSVALPIRPARASSPRSSPSLRVPALDGQSCMLLEAAALASTASVSADAAAPVSLPSASFRGTSDAASSSAPVALQLQVGSHTLAGQRGEDWVNQDAHLAVAAGPERMLVGVFDGHGEHGHVIATGVRELFTQVSPLLPAISEAALPYELRRLFVAAEDAVERTGLAEWSGTTATIALIDAAAGVVSVAHVGDSRLLIATGPQPEVAFQTVDHIVDTAAQQRILEHGGEVRQVTISGVAAHRVFLKDSDMPGLGMARALGDTQARSVGVTSEPTITFGLALPPGSALVVASDGVWEKVSPLTVAAIALSTDAEAAAKEIVKTAMDCWSADTGDIDDITAVVIRALPVPPQQS